ncbi:MAG: DUF488 family protein [Cyanobacteria bacterium]|nr:DUF488 family protein [Cyanobacteriota bacterium]
MLDQGSLKQVKESRFNRDESHIVITMRYYPRFLKKELRDEFLCALAPEKQLLKEFNDAQKTLGNHNASFAHVDYNRRFDLSKDALDHLKRLSDISAEKHVYMVCICDIRDRCHREILMLLGQELFACEIGKVYHDYPEFMERLPEIRKTLGY